jgi:cyclomaltodextrinase
MNQITTPAWVHDAVFYQIFPDRFARSTSVYKPNYIEPWDSSPTIWGYKGGDLIGVIEHLDYLQDLGITAIYFNPIFQSASNHRYHTHDYYQIDPLLGGNEAFRKLRRETERRGIRIILDGVFNHASRGLFYFNDILENGISSPWLDWFTIQNWPLSPYDPDKPANYVAWFNLRALPRWNTDNPDVREYLIRVGEHWIREGIDGWRLDVPNEITSPGFWSEFRSRIRAINPGAYITGEIWGDATQWLAGDQFDSVMNYVFNESVIQFIGREYTRVDLVQNHGYHPYPPLNAREYGQKIEQLLAKYDPAINAAMFNLLSSHDVARLRSIVDNRESTIRLATLLLCTYPGTPSIYYGDEIGLEGGNDPDCRRTFPWDHPENWNQTALAYHKQFIALRRSHVALRQGDYHSIYPTEQDTGSSASDVYAFIRSTPEEMILVAVNRSSESYIISIPNDRMNLPTRPLQILLGGEHQITQIDTQITLQIPAEDAIVLGW